MKCLQQRCSVLFLWMVFAPIFSFAQSTLCGLNAPIFDNSCTASSNFPINVSGINGTQLGTDVILQEVRFIIDHTWDDDLDIKLFSPSGIEVELSTDNGGGANHYGDPTDPTCTKFTSLSMNACFSIEEGVAPFIGSYIPEGNLNDFNDNTDPEGTWVLQACDDAAVDAGVVHYVELVFAEMSCPSVTMLRADSLGDGSVIMTWVEGGGCTNTLLEYGPAGFIPGAGSAANEGTLVSLSCPIVQPFEISGLGDLTTYDVYIREQCSNGGFSSNSCPLTITTNCNTPEPTLLENFDTLSDCSTSCGADCSIIGTWFNSTTDDFDWIIDGGGTGSSNTGPSDDVTGGKQYIYTEASGSLCRNGNQAVLQSECLLVNATSSVCHLSFYYHMFGTHINELRLEVSTDAGANWVMLWSEIGSQGDQWIRNYIDLFAYNNKIATFRFVAIGGDGIKGDMALDEIAFYGATEVIGGGNVFYADQDGDGFGDANNSVLLCTALIPAGYVDNSADCDDTSAAISPLATEVPCNTIDENCDGVFLQVLPIPEVTDQIVCVGNSAALTVNGLPEGEWYWTDEDENILFVGTVFNTPALQQNAFYWVQDSIVNTCTSPRQVIMVSVDVGPDVATNDQPVLCSGDVFDMTTLNLFDGNNNVVNLSYHSTAPTTPNSELPSPLVEPLENTTYYLRAETINGCFQELGVNVVVNDTPSVFIVAENNAVDVCANSLTTLIGYEGGTGLVPLTYLWDDGTTSIERVILPSIPGSSETYQLEVTDANACTGLGTVVINTLASITAIEISELSDVSFCNGDDGYMTLTPVNGQAPYIYQWSGPVSGNGITLDSSYVISDLEQGTYRVTITDSSGGACSVFIPNIIINGSGVEVDADINITPVSCNGGGDGGIDINVLTGGIPTYLWSNDETTQDLQNVPAGSYSVTITDGICETILTDLEVTNPTVLEMVIANTKAVSCFSESDGLIDVNISGGIIPYIYEWSNNVNTEDLDGLPEGEYQLTVIDANGCSLISENISITGPEILEAVVDDSGALSCEGGADGYIEVSVFGGTSPYAYEWSDGQLTEDVSGLAAGSYELTLTDANGCSLVAGAISIPEPSSLLLTVSILGAPSCNQASNGIIEMDIVGGTPPYSYAWNNGMLTEDISDLPEGDYQLTVTDANGCIQSGALLTLAAPEVLFFGLTFINEETCTGVADGSITIQVFGGTEPYSYQWSSGHEVEDIDNLPAGEYQVTVTDSNGCTTASTDLEVVALAPLGSNLESQQHISCVGETDGSIYIAVPPEGSPYEYAWTNGAETEDLENLPAGTYQAEITASNGCTFLTPEYIITEPDALSLDVTSIEPPSCNGFVDGSIDVSINGGTEPYTFSWNNSFTEEDLIGVPSGTYSLAVIDQNGCVVGSNNLILTEPEVLYIEDVVASGVGCIDSIGNIIVEVSGGVLPYAYIWNTGDEAAVINNKPAGVYSLSITDANDCFLINSALTIDQLADTLDVYAIEDSPVSCFGESDANLSVQMSGGNYPFQFNWSNGVTDSLNQDLAGGEYSVTVTDNYGCVGYSDVLTVTSPSDINFYVDYIEDNLCSGDDEGVISIVASGGVGPLSVNWSNGLDSSYIDQLENGAYTVTITDQNNCTEVSVQPIIVSGPNNAVFGEIVGSDHINCFGDMDANLSLISSGGVGGYSLLWNTGSEEENIESLGAGWYQCTITDANNCVYVTPGVVIEGPDAPLGILPDSTLVLDNENCDGMNGEIVLVVNGGTQPYEYLWNVGSQDPDLMGLTSDDYSCTVTDSYGCSTEGLFTIEEPENTLLLNTTSTLDTNNMNTGTGIVEVSGGSWPFVFQWDAATGSQTDSIAINLAAGTYTVTITDAHECSQVVEVLVDSVTIIIDAVSETNALGSFRYYPNPIQDLLTVEVETNEAADLVLRMYTVLGGPIREERELNSRKEIFVLDMKDLPGAVYLLVLEVDGKRELSRVVVKGE